MPLTSQKRETSTARSRCSRDVDVSRHHQTMPWRTYVTTTTERRATPVRPFTIDVPEKDLADLRARIAATRWPEKETVDDASQGVQLATMQALARYWADEYDWRK